MSSGLTRICQLPPICKSRQFFEEVKSKLKALIEIQIELSNNRLKVNYIHVQFIISNRNVIFEELSKETLKRSKLFEEFGIRYTILNTAKLFDVNGRCIIGKLL